MRKRVRAAQREKITLRSEILRIRAERQEVALKMDAVRIRHEQDNTETLVSSLSPCPARFLPYTNHWTPLSDPP